MKKSLLIIPLLLLLAVTPAVASKEKEKKTQETLIEQCDPEKDWKNHGQYVSCVAKQHKGNDAAVSEAAHSALRGRSPSRTSGCDIARRVERV